MKVFGLRFGDDRRRGKKPGVKSALHTAVQHGGLSAIRAEIESGNVINTFDENCETPLDIAIRNKNRKARKLLEENFALTADQLASLPPGPPGRYDGEYRAFVVVVTAKLSSRLARLARNSENTDDRLGLATIGAEMSTRQDVPCYLNSRHNNHEEMLTDIGTYIRICACPANLSILLKFYKNNLKKEGFTAIRIRIADRSEYEGKLDDTWHFISETSHKRRVPDYEAEERSAHREAGPSSTIANSVSAADGSGRDTQVRNTDSELDRLVRKFLGDELEKDRREIVYWEAEKKIKKSLRAHPELSEADLDRRIEEARARVVDLEASLNKGSN